MSEIIEALDKPRAETKGDFELRYCGSGTWALLKWRDGFGDYLTRGTESDVLAHINSLLPEEERGSEGPTILPEMTPEEVAECKAARKRGATIQYRVRDQSRGATEWKDCLGEPWWAIYHSIYRPKPGTNPGEQPTQHETEPKYTSADFQPDDGGSDDDCKRCRELLNREKVGKGA